MQTLNTIRFVGHEVYRTSVVGAMEGYKTTYSVTNSEQGQFTEHSLLG